MEVIEPKVIHHINGGVMEGTEVKKYEKRLSQMQQVYQDPSGINENTLLYTVYSYSQGPENKLGNLCWGLTILEPVLINGECNMTRGHYHANPDCAEFYLGAGGEGLLLLMDRSGRTWAEHVHEGSLHYIDGTWAHRLVNTGEVPCKVAACWPTASGHDYAAIEEKDFPERVFKKDGKVIFVKR